MGVSPDELPAYPNTGMTADNGRDRACVDADFMNFQKKIVSLCPCPKTYHVSS